MCAWFKPIVGEKNSQLSQFCVLRRRVDIEYPNFVLTIHMHEFGVMYEGISIAKKRQDTLMSNRRRDRFVFHPKVKVASKFEIYKTSC